MPIIARAFFLKHFRRFFQAFPEEAVVEMSGEILELVATKSYEPALLRLKSLEGMCRVDLDPEAWNTFMPRVAEDKLEAEQQVRHASRVHRAVSRANAAAHPTGFELDLRGPANGRHLRRRRQRLSLISVVVFKKSLRVRIAVGITPV